MYRDKQISRLLRYYLFVFIALCFYLMAYVSMRVTNRNLNRNNSKRTGEIWIYSPDVSTLANNVYKSKQITKKLFTKNETTLGVASKKSNGKKNLKVHVVHQEKVFFVNTSQCRMPFVNPFSREALKIYKPKKKIICSNETDLVTPRFDVKQKRYVLNINETFAKELLKSNTEGYNCSYDKIVRNTEDDSYKKSMEKKYFTQGYVVPLDVEGMLVDCHLTSNISHKLQRDAFFLVQHKVPDYGNRMSVPRHTLSTPKSPPRKPSVIMFGIDSLSRINFRRTMPKVFEHMRRSGWYELQGYNKVGDNTLPNLLAVLSGYKSTKTICNELKPVCVDRLPIIWKDFKNASYLTAYGEDMSDISTFNYKMPGFQSQPTDFYLRPFLKAIEDNMHKGNKHNPFCIGRRILSSYVYDFCRHYMQRFVDEYPIFGLFWTNHFSHDHWEMPALMSDKILQYLSDFEADGVMKSTIMIFLSDHGSRFGGLTKLPEGFLEERLPTMFLWLPPWFREEYPEYVRALEINRNRLTSNYDLHMTLKHIIELGTPYDLKLAPAHDCPKCQSVFYPVPENRTCADAGIIDHWCTCYPYRIVTSIDYATDIPYLIVDRMNEYFVKKNLTGLCSYLEPRYLNRIELKLNLNEKGEHIVQDVDTYRTKFTVRPNNAQFEATVLFNNRTKVVDIDVESISRLNLYHNDSLCIDNKEMKKYCICYSSIKTD